ncbi:MAG: CoA-binding protein [Nitrospirota bacterium]
MNSLDLLFNPESITLIGASHTVEKLGGVILRNLLRFKGEVYPVNPKYTELMGMRSYKSIKDIPRSFDLAIIMRPAPEVPEILRELRGRCSIAVIMSSGFAEIGETGLQNETKRIAKDTGIRILGPNCMGIYNPYKKLDVFFLPYERLQRPKKGNVAVVSQSGAILSCLLGSLKASNTGVSKVVGYGNALDIDESEIYEYLYEDKDTDAVISYIESLSDGRKFIGKAKALSEKKALIVLKSGKSPSGQAAAFSHTGRLAGSYEVFHSIFRQYGIREAADFDELMDATKALSYYPSLPPLSKGLREGGSRVCIITNGGGSGVLAADECMRQGLEVAALPDDKKRRLLKVFPHFYGINNPLDLTAQVKDEDYLNALNELKDDYEGFLVIALANVLGITGQLAEMINDSKANINKPIVFHIARGGISGRLSASLERSGIPVYPSPERAVRGLKALLT